MKDVWILLVLATGDGSSDYGLRPMCHEFGTQAGAEKAAEWFNSKGGANVRATVVHEVRA